MDFKKVAIDILLSTAPVVEKTLGVAAFLVRNISDSQHVVRLTFINDKFRLEVLDKSMNVHFKMFINNIDTVKKVLAKLMENVKSTTETGILQSFRRKVGIGIGPVPHFELECTGEELKEDLSLDQINKLSDKEKIIYVLISLTPDVYADGEDLIIESFIGPVRFGIQERVKLSIKNKKLCAYLLEIGYQGITAGEKSGMIIQTLDVANKVLDRLLEVVKSEDDKKLLSDLKTKLESAASTNEQLTEAAQDSDFLVVDKKTGERHLPVKKNGKADHNLMGAAWAALTKGYRGNKYTGPDKGSAMSKLKALYHSEKMDLPKE